MAGNEEVACFNQIDTDKESMLALLATFSTAVYPSSSYIQSLPNSRIHSSTSIHSCPTGNTSIHSCPNVNNNAYTCSNNNKVHSCISSMQPNCILPHPPGNINYATSGNLTSQSIKKMWMTDSDADMDLLNVCRICQQPGDDDDDALFSPCRCSGSLKYVHYSCLMKWIGISTKKTRKPPRCELCQFLYIRQKRFRLHDWHMPRVSSQDKCLHVVFFLTLAFMVGCAVATVMCFLSESGQISQIKSHLSREEVITLACAVLFFVSFFVAMTVEIRARHTVYRLFVKFLLLNTEWHIESYDKTRDPDSPKPYIYNV